MSSRLEPWAVHSTLHRSRANGPGERFVVWTQGCTLACPGCFNPMTHDLRPPSMDVGGVIDLLLPLLEDLEGVTVTGGEPLEQPIALAAFASLVRRHTSLTLVLLTGYTRAEIERDQLRQNACSDFDMIVAGRYRRSEHLAQGLRGSSNKSYLALTNRYTASDFHGLPDAEVTITPFGSAIFTGMASAASLGVPSHDDPR